jgi:Zn-dependent M16 (insulinase) family peptidase
MVKQSKIAEKETKPTTPGSGISE